MEQQFFSRSLNFNRFIITHNEPSLVAVWENENDRQGLIGIFNVNQRNTKGNVIQMKNLPDGIYSNYLSDVQILPSSSSSSINFPSTIDVSNGGSIPVPLTISILHYSGFLLHPQMFYTDLFDFDYHQL